MEWWRYFCSIGWTPSDVGLWIDDQHDAIPPDSLAGTFTRQERADLRAVRDRTAAARDCDEMGLDEQRLQFARWLVGHGRMGEGA